MTGIRAYCREILAEYGFTAEFRPNNYNCTMNHCNAKHCKRFARLYLVFMDPEINKKKELELKEVDCEAL